MSTVVLRRRRPKPQDRASETVVIGPGANGRLMTPAEFDRADFEDGWRYELINGVLVVSPIPSVKEVDPNEDLGHMLRTYKETHPKGSSLNATLPERIVKTGKNRRRADRLIWAGLRRLPRKNETPTVIAEFVSPGKRSRERDYEAKRDEYMALDVQEYWIIDRFDRCMVVFYRKDGQIRRRVIREDQTYRTPLLPGFLLPLARLLAAADQWAEDDEE